MSRSHSFDSREPPSRHQQRRSELHRTRQDPRDSPSSHRPLGTHDTQYLPISRITPAQAVRNWKSARRPSVPAAVERLPRVPASLVAGWREICLVAQAQGIITGQAECSLEDALAMIADRAQVSHCSAEEIAGATVNGRIRFNR
jgi:hypothetical protein